MTAARRVAALLAGLWAMLSCQAPEPMLQVSFTKQSSTVTATLATDSLAGAVIGTDFFTLFGVMYAVVACDNYTVEGDQSGSGLSLDVIAHAGSQCPHEQRRMTYTLTAVNLESGTYQLTLRHREPDTPSRPARTVFQGPVVIQ